MEHFFKSATVVRRQALHHSIRPHFWHFDNTQGYRPSPPPQPRLTTQIFGYLRKRNFVCFAPFWEQEIRCLEFFSRKISNIFLFGSTLAPPIITIPPGSGLVIGNLFKDNETHPIQWHRQAVLSKFVLNRGPHSQTRVQIRGPQI